MARADRLVRCLFSLLTLCVLTLSVPVRADELADFEEARAAYDAQEYTRAVELFEALVGVSPPRLTDRLLVLESRKYLGASLLFVGAKARAKEQFRLLVLEEPTYLLDPLAFPTEVVQVFEQVKAEVQAELDRAAAEERERLANEVRLRREAEQLRRENLARLTEIARIERVQQVNSRWIATVPFGVGQFQNGHNGLGSALAMAEGLAVATSVFTFIFHQQLRDEEVSPADVGDAQRREELWRTVNITSFAAFAALAVIGIVDAHVRFKPEQTTERTRPLPADLETWSSSETGGTMAPGPRIR